MTEGEIFNKPSDKIIMLLFFQRECEPLLVFLPDKDGKERIYQINGYICHIPEAMLACSSRLPHFVQQLQLSITWLFWWFTVILQNPVFCWGQTSE